MRNKGSGGLFATRLLFEWAARWPEEIALETKLRNDGRRVLGNASF
jgi:hypothetical protein